MKYTKKYPIHPKPDKQFSGASIFKFGGDTLKVKDPNDPRLKAYNDSLFKFQEAVRDTYPLKNDLRQEGKTFIENTYPLSKFPDYVESYKNDKNKPVGIGQISIPEYTWDYPLYKKPVNVVELEKQTPVSNKIEKKVEQNTSYKQEPVSKDTMQNIMKKKYFKKVGDKEIPISEEDYQKTIKAFGGFKYPNGGSFYDSSNINTSKPQVNTVPSSYTNQFNGNYSSTPKPTKDGINFTKDGKIFNTNTNVNTGSAFSGNYLGMATAAIGGIGNTVNNANAATNEQDKNRAIERGTVDTTMNIVDTAFPIVGAVEGVAGGIGAVIDSTNPSTSYTDPNTGKTYNYKKGDSGTSAAGFKAAVDPRGNATNFIGDITGTTENYGQSDFGMGVADLFVPFLSQAFRNKQAEKAANQAQLNNSLMNAQGVDSNATNFSAFGGYKNKFPYGGHVNTFNLAQMAYGGNMQSEVTGQSYLKDQVDDFSGKNFKTHEGGGVAVGGNNEVEKNEVVYKDYVFSDRLKDAKGNSYAARAKKLISQIK
jgi:hypothetical protein